MADSPDADAVREEVERLHRFFVAWFSGACENEPLVFERELLRRLDEQFVLVPPAGTALSRGDLSSGIRAAYNSNPNFRIAIRNLRVRHTWERHLLVTYEEWQRNARASTPPDNARIATALFELRDELKWLHVHETWLPEVVMLAGPFDF